jgi:UDP-glucuronate 4-epimerase
MKKILITGAAGFIGSSLADALLLRGDRVVGLDNLIPQYDPAVKRSHIIRALENPMFKFFEKDVTDMDSTAGVAASESPDCVVHIAGRTGMRASIDNPEPFFRVNVSGALAVLEACRSAKIKQFIYISSGSVYGTAGHPVAEDYPLPPPANPYSATKLLGERLTQAYAELCGLNTTVLRIFTVYGPRQRPEMAIHSFVNKIEKREPVHLYGDGSDCRDYLYIDNCVDAIMLAIDRPFSFEVFNIGEQRTQSLNVTVSLLSDILEIPAHVKYIPAPDGIPRATFADIGKAGRMLGYFPRISLEDGLRRFISWHRNTENK